MKRRWRWLVLVAVLAVGGVALAVVRSPRFQKWYDPPVLVLPADDEIAEMRASLRKSQVGFEPIPEFVVPVDHVPLILGWIRPAEYIREPWTLRPSDELGEVAILTREGRELALRFYWAGKNPAVLTSNGEDTFWGRGVNGVGRPIDGGIGLGHAVREAHKASHR